MEWEKTPIPDGIIRHGDVAGQLGRGGPQMHGLRACQFPLKGFVCGAGKRFEEVRISDKREAIHLQP
jgi:hypothetical protein